MFQLTVGTVQLKRTGYTIQNMPIMEYQFNMMFTQVVTNV